MFKDIMVFITQDKIFFWLIQVFLLSLFFFGFFIERLNKESGRALKRGQVAKKIFYLAYGITSVILFQIITVSTEAIGYKVFFTILDLLLLFYLCFFNSWSRNKIIGIYGKFENKIENL